MSILQTPTIKFTNNMRLALQGMGPILAPHAIQQQGAGEQVEITNLVQQTSPKRRSTRFEPVAMTTNDFQRRWAPATPTYYDTRGVDSEDQLIVEIDLQGAGTQSLAAMIGRVKDQAFLEGFYGTNYTGKRGETAVTFAAANVVAVNVGAAGPTGINVPKLRAARRVLQKNLVDVNRETLWMALSADEVESLLGEVQMINFDFNKMDEPVIRNGKLTRLFGFNFLEIEFSNPAVVGAEVAALTLDGSGYRRVPFWCESGMAVATWTDMETYVAERTDLAGKPKMIYAGTRLTATRTEEGKCGQILCVVP